MHCFHIVVLVSLFLFFGTSRAGNDVFSGTLESASIREPQGKASEIQENVSRDGKEINKVSRKTTDDFGEVLNKSKEKKDPWPSRESFQIRRNKRNIHRMKMTPGKMKIMPSAVREDGVRKTHGKSRADRTRFQELHLNDVGDTLNCQKPKTAEVDHTRGVLKGEGTHRPHECLSSLFCPGSTETNTFPFLTSSPRPHECGDEFCCCCGTNAICSGHAGRLRYIPRLPDVITALDFSYNQLTAIDSPDFFHNVTQLHVLDLSHNELTYLEDKAFSRLHNLSELWLNDNSHLDVSQNGAAVFGISRLKSLDVSDTISGRLPSDIFTKHGPLQLQRLRLNDAGVRQWPMSTFSALLHLESLELINNDMGSITASSRPLAQLTYLSLMMNDLHSFPQTCFQTDSGERQSLYPRLEYLDLSSNYITNLTEEVCLPKLRVLKLRKNPIFKLVKNMFNTLQFPSLVCLNLTNIRISQSGTEDFAFNNTALTTLDLMYNNVDFVNKRVARKTFHGLPGLVFLQLEHNYLDNRRFMELFSELGALRFVFLGNTYMNTLTTQTFQSFPGLQRITLHRNPFSQLPDGVFDGLPYLRKVDLSNCRITTIGQDTFSSDTRRRLTHLDLSGNHFHCDCHLLWFRDWLQSNDSVFNHSYTQYNCINLHKTPVTDFHMKEQVCLMSRDASVFTVVVVSLLMIILTLVAVVFRYRWSIRLLLYEAFRGKGHNCRLPAHSFRYDVFVSYAEPDTPWVRQHLVPVLEGGLGVRLCIHQRDFTPGQNIVDNIYHSVQESRKVLMVFSRPFARSQWCQFELALCLSHVVEHDDTLLIACVDDVTGSAELTPTMMAVLNTTTYIQWAAQREARDSFYGRLRIALNDVIPRRD